MKLESTCLHCYYKNAIIAGIYQPNFDTNFGFDKSGDKIECTYKITDKLAHMVIDALISCAMKTMWY